MSRWSLTAPLVCANPCWVRLPRVVSRGLILFLVQGCGDDELDEACPPEQTAAEAGDFRVTLDNALVDVRAGGVESELAFSSSELLFRPISDCDTVDDCEVLFKRLSFVIEDFDVTFGNEKTTFEKLQIRSSEPAPRSRTGSSFTIEQHAPWQACARVNGKGQVVSAALLEDARIQLNPLVQTAVVEVRFRSDFRDRSRDATVELEGDASASNSAPFETVE